MDKTININLGGILFQIDEEAFRILRDYLQSINSHFGNKQGGHETIEDIESRIAEIFQSHNGLAGVISKENVESMISIIGKPEDFDPSGPEIEGMVRTTQKKRMYRNPDDIIIGGVCSGIAAYLDTDSVLIRILFAFALFFGVGFIAYMILWIAIPKARTDSEKRAMYGNPAHSEKIHSQKNENTQAQGTQLYNTDYSNQSPVGNALNEIFRAIGKVCYIILRIFLIIIGISLVLTGFLSILSFIIIVLFKYPGVFSFDSTGANLFYITDFLYYLVNPSTVPWILFLTSIAFILPMLALIYWGVKMIFWFRARDGVVSLVAFLVWVGSITALAIIEFNEGISFAETGKMTVETILPKSPDTLYIATDNKIADLKYDKQISFGHEAYSVFLNDTKKELYIRPYISIDRSDDKNTRVEMRKRSTGRTESEAIKKTEGIQFSYSLRGDSLKIDEYFTIPSGRKWAADKIGIHLYVPTGTVLNFDVPSRAMIHSHFIDINEEYRESRWESRSGSWVMTQDGLEPVSGNNRK